MATTSLSCSTRRTIAIGIATSVLFLAAAVSLVEACFHLRREADPVSYTDSNLQKLRRAQLDSLVAAPHWTDQKHGRVSIPIGEAMRILAANDGKITFPSYAPPSTTPVATGGNGAVPPGLNPASVAAGRKIYQTVGCAACHPIDGTNTINGAPAPGPSFKDLFGSTVPLEGGQSVLADAAYIRESIRFPQAKIHRGYTAVQMPNFGTAISDKDINNVIAFLKACSKNYRPPNQ